MNKKKISKTQISSCFFFFINFSFVISIQKRTKKKFPWFTHDNFKIENTSLKCICDKGQSRNKILSWLSIMRANRRKKTLQHFSTQHVTKDGNNSQINLNTWSCTAHGTQPRSMLKQLNSLWLLFFVCWLKYREIDVKVSILPFFWSMFLFSRCNVPWRFNYIGFQIRTQCIHENWLSSSAFVIFRQAERREPIELITTLFTHERFDYWPNNRSLAFVFFPSSSLSFCSTFLCFGQVSV